MKKIFEKENSFKIKEIKEKIERELEDFDLMSLNFKNIFNNENIKKKYAKNIVADIKIIYFDHKQIPLQAIFVFCDGRGNNMGNEKKLFSGAYKKEEFIKICGSLFNEKRIVKVELLMDFADMNKNSYLNWMEPNEDLLIDFYFLVKINI